MTTRDLLALYNSMFSDSALEQKGTTYISTTQAEDMDITFTLFTSDSKVTGYSMTMKADQEGAIVSVDASMKGKELAMTMEMSTPAVIDEGLRRLHSRLHLHRDDGRHLLRLQHPAPDPAPAGADVVDLMEQLTVEMDPVSV